MFQAKKLITMRLGSLDTLVGKTTVWVEARVASERAAGTDGLPNGTRIRWYATKRCRSNEVLKTCIVRTSSRSFSRLILARAAAVRSRERRLGHLRSTNSFWSTFHPAIPVRTKRWRHRSAFSSPVCAWSVCRTRLWLQPRLLGLKSCCSWEMASLGE
jgi:hypothetical protein